MRRAPFLIALALLLPTVSSSQEPEGYPWTCAQDDLADSITLCVVAPEPTMRRYITDIVAQSTTSTAGQFNLYHGTGSNCGTGETDMFPSTGGAAASRFLAAANTVKPTMIGFVTPLLVPAGKDLCVLGDGGNSITIQVFGYVAP
jgi:hypothetical protein